MDTRPHVLVVPFAPPVRSQRPVGSGRAGPFPLHLALPTLALPCGTLCRLSPETRCSRVTLCPGGGGPCRACRGRAPSRFPECLGHEDVPVGTPHPPMAAVRAGPGAHPVPVSLQPALRRHPEDRRRVASLRLLAGERSRGAPRRPSASGTWCLGSTGAAPRGFLRVHVMRGPRALQSRNTSSGVGPRCFRNSYDPRFIGQTFIFLNLEFNSFS